MAVCSLRPGGEKREKTVTLAIEQIRKKIKRGKGLWGQLVTSPDGPEWIWMQLTPAALKYYQERVTCYGFIPDEGIGALGAARTGFKKNRY
jgi:hypothetical protein